jgi:hypothetical protein
VTAGNRRLAALRKLQETGGSIQGVKVTDEFPVHVIVKSRGRRRRLRIEPGREPDAAAGNAGRGVPRLRQDGQDDAGQGDRGAVRHHREARQAAAEAWRRCIPTCSKALDKGKITMEAAQAFTIEPDRASRRPISRRRRAGNCTRNIKNAFTQKLVRGDSDLAS